MSRFILIFLIFIFLLALIGCSTSENWDRQYKVAILQDLYFMEAQYGKSRCDNFLNDSEILNELKESYPDVSNEVLNECQELRKKRSNSYNRK